MNALDKAIPFVAQLADNPGVQHDLDRAVGLARQAYARGRRRKNVKEAARDTGVRRRLIGSAAAARSAALAVNRGRELERRRHRRAPLLVAGVLLTGAAVVALYPAVRDQLAAPAPSTT